MSDTNRFSRRRFLQATGGAAGAVALAGCTGGDSTPTPEPSDGGDGGGGDGEDTPEPTATPEAKKGGTLNLINSTITTFDPIKATDTASGRVIQQMFDALMNYPNGETAVVKQLAESFETNDDFTQYTFTLADATFHNGDAVTAEDFVYSFERLAGSQNSNRQYFILDSLGMVHETDGDGNYVKGSLGVSAADETTLTIELNQAFASTLSMLAYTSFAAVPAGIAGDDPTNDAEAKHTEFATKNPIGAGAFQFENWDQGNEANVVRYDDYYGDVALLDGINWAVIEDDDAAFTYAMNKNADAFSIPTAKYDPNLVQIEETDDLGRQIGKYGPLQNDETAEYAKIPTVSTYYFGFNTNNVPKPVRQAVAYATNQKEFADQVFKSRVAPGYHLTPPLIYPGGGNAYTSHAEESYPYGYNSVDIEGAKAVMEEAGYSDSNRYEMQWTQYTSQSWKQMAQILQDRLSAAYIDMKIEEAEFSTLLQRGRNGNLEAYTLGWIADWPAPDNFLQLIYPPRTDTSQSGPLSYTNWSGTEAADAAEAAFKKVLDNREPTEEAQKIRNEAYVTMEEANWEDVVFVNTFHGIEEPMNYSNVHIPIHGAMGASRQMHNHTWKDQ
jgi:ABC-type transport system substrate-binding protein